MRLPAPLVCLLVFSAAITASVPNPHAIYLSGTAGIPNGAEGTLNLGDGKNLRFAYDQEVFELPYDRITSFELESKAGTKAALSEAVGWVPKIGKSPGSLLIIEFQDESGTGQAATFEIGKRDFQAIEPVLEARTGRRVRDVASAGMTKNRASAVSTPEISSMVPVTITSTPSGAFVSLWGQPVGKTPVSTRLTPGAYTFQVAAEGFAPWTRNVDLEAGRPVVLSAELARRDPKSVVIVH